MPELPEVETTARGIRPHLEGRRIVRLIVREPRLRRPIPPEMPERLAGQPIHSLRRRGKYLLIELAHGSLLVHLGMSGSLRLVAPESAPRMHDHLDLSLSDGGLLRFHDPRRFGIFLWIPQAPETALVQHPLLCRLGPEPLGEHFDGEYLYRASRVRRITVKSFIMDAAVVVGVGNIYANESLFLAGIHPACACNQIDPAGYDRLAETIRLVLGAAIEQGGTTLRDFVNESGAPGYFAQSLRVYGRAGEPCRVCGTPIQQQRIGQRSSFYCPRCQTLVTADSHPR
ncbi:bifunctional DNA-formamidopyrimidine glycosylase/DNA-(apurinic or apyrimidinic site) lyase [Thermochromatium tepidum]|uniref:Formamidopyrimidine-DNA glycosylase n=1 Tax=Thermochromatium tepidum ATCC 43061 TaxID=316276 RepID=A0A6I6E620_THETI|nr:bifunctional DNA-formamidopyrimidine glycosylase/DNA-(apurinic or apyrimidinic site) lyase [Thermochromatium tepidum]QGU31938.1 bifunctional DNA-formamidopyrimidine glycosylase/DNA-(apurinic or apyrimidinic site) lyase [Thermochromatium tepidum ATCC 43061]